MRKAMLGVLVGAGLVMAAIAVLVPEDRVFAQRPAPELRSTGGRDLIALLGPTDNSGQLLMVIDPQMRAMSVYHVEGATGKIALKSVRNIRYDLQMTHLNTEDPLPQYIQSLLEQNSGR